MNIFNLFFMLKIALKHWLALALAAVICAGTAFVYVNYMLPPQYKAKGSLMVTNGTILNESEVEPDDKLLNTDITASYNFLDTVADMLETSGIYEQLAEVTGNKYNYTQLKGMTSIVRRDDHSLYIDIEFITGTPQEAVIMINKYLDLVPDYIDSKVLNSAVSIEYADSAVEVNMSSLSAMLLAGIAGAAIVYLIFFLIYSADTVIRDEESFKDHLDINVIGVVPDFASSKSTEKKYYKYNRYYGYGYGYGYGGRKNAK